MNFSQFEKKWVDEINNNLLKDFPKDFIDNIDCELLNMPGIPLVKGSELFGNFEITNLEGETFLSTPNQFKVKYILYANSSFPKEINIPKNDFEFEKIVKNYEDYLDNLFRIIEKDYKKEFRTTKDLISTTNNIFRRLNLKRY